MNKLSKIYEMPRPVGVLNKSWYNALEHVRQSREEFTPKEFYDIIKAYGGGGSAPTALSSQLRRLTADEGEKPSARKPLVFVKKGHKGPGGTAIFKYAFNGPPGNQRKSDIADDEDDKDIENAKLQISKHGVKNVTNQHGDKNLALKGSMSPKDKGYFSRRADIQNQAQDKRDPNAPNPYADAIEELENGIGKQRFAAISNLWSKMPSLNAVINNIFATIPPDFQKSAIMVANTIKGGGRDPSVPVGPPSKRPGAKSDEDEPKSVARTALANFIAKGAEKSAEKETKPKQEPKQAKKEPTQTGQGEDDDYDPWMALYGLDQSKPKQDKEPAPEEPSGGEEPEDKEELANDEEPEDQEEPSDDEEFTDDDGEGEFGEEEPSDEEDSGWMSPSWLPYPDHVGNRYEAAMARLSDEGIGPQNPIWQKIADSNSGVEAHMLIRKSDIPENMRGSALSVAKSIFQELNKDWDKNEHWKRSAYSKIKL